MSFEATFLFLILFTEVLANEKPHDKTTEEVKIHLLTITVLNTGNYRIVKLELKNFAKKENIGTNKKTSSNDTSKNAGQTILRSVRQSRIQPTTDLNGRKRN